MYTSLIVENIFLSGEWLFKVPFGNRNDSEPKKLIHIQFDQPESWGIEYDVLIRLQTSSVFE